MKANICKLLFFLTILTTPSYANNKVKILEVNYPARVNLAKETTKLTIVDNTGTRIVDNIPESDNFDIRSWTKDSLMVAVAKVLNDKKHFKEVKLFPHTTREDTKYNTESILMPDTIAQIAKSMNANAVLTIDRFDLRLGSTTANHKNVQLNAAKNNLILHFRVYDANGDSIAPAIVLTDSILWVRNEDVKYEMKAYIYLIDQMSSKITNQLISRSEQQKRIYFTLNGKSAKQGVKHADKNNWSGASTAWGAAFLETRDHKQKALLAANLALAYEYQDELDEAIKWIKVAVNLINIFNEDENKIYINKYIEQLEEKRQFITNFAE